MLLAVPLTVEDVRTGRLARELAHETGESITVAARVAIEERLARVRRRAARQEHRDALREIVERGRSRPVLDRRPADEVLGHDADGLPR